MLRCQTHRRALSRFALLFSLCGFLCLPAARPVQAEMVQLTSFGMDQHVLAPTTQLIRIYGSVVQNGSGGGGWVLHSATITVDGTAYPATLTDNVNFYIDWDASQATNPSEHSSSASAQVQKFYINGFYGPIVTLSSTAALPPPNGPYPDGTFYGDGRATDFIIAALHLQSFTFDKSIPLRNYADANPPAMQNPPPPLVPAPVWAYDQNGKQTSGWTPMAYKQNTAIPFTITLQPLTGGATIGFTLDLTAKPTATNEAALVLYQTGTTPQAFSGAISLTSKVPLYKEVNVYQTIIADLRFWVQFTYSTNNWAIVSTYADAGKQGGNTVYALLSDPSAPMSPPWTNVLDYACQYAAGTSDATTATTALTTGLYNHGVYNGGYRAFTNAVTTTNPNGDVADGFENFKIAGFTGTSLNGQCDDFADFLVCMSNAIGALPLSAQRSATASDIHNGSGFMTNPITWSATQGTPPATSAGTPVHWSYHQWAMAAPDNVFDGSLRFGGTTSPINMPMTTFYPGLVATLDHNYQPTDLNQDWRPQAGFLPTPIN